MPDTFIKDIIENPHTVFKKYFNYWNFLLDSYEGGVDYTCSNVPNNTIDNKSSSPIQIKVNGQSLEDKSSFNLFKHPKERDTDYKRRLGRSYYYNFCAPVVDIYTDHLFRNPITEDFKSLQNIVEKRIDNIDRKGSSLIEIRKEIAEFAQLYGHAFIVVDMPKSNGEVNLQQRIDNNQFPFLCLFPPQRVINWSLDAFGRPFWVLLAEVADSNSDPLMFDKTKDNAPNINYRLWTRQEWMLFNSEYKLIDAGTHPVGEVPIVAVYNKKSKKHRSFLGISEIADVSFIARDIYNLCSELGQIISDQTFSFLAIQGNPQDYGGDQVLGVGKGLIYPENANVPQYVAPDSASADVIMKQIDRQINKIFQIVKLEGGSAHQERQIKEQSGIAKAFDFHQTNSSLSKKSSNLNDAELRVWQLFAKWEGKEFDGSVDYPDDFSVSAVNDDIKEALEAIKLDVGNIAKIEMNKAILKKKFPRMPEDEFATLIEDMETSVRGSQNNNGNGFNGRLRDRLNLFRNTTVNSGGGSQTTGGNNV